MLSDIRYADWEPVGAEQGQNSQGQTAPNPAGLSAFPRTIRIHRPHDDYRLDLQITKLALNEGLPLDRFQLEQPAGSELVRVGEDAGEKQK